MITITIIILCTTALRVSLFIVKCGRHRLCLATYRRSPKVRFMCILKEQEKRCQKEHSNLFNSQPDRIRILNASDMLTARIKDQIMRFNFAKFLHYFWKVHFTSQTQITNYHRLNNNCDNSMSVVRNTGVAAVLQSRRRRWWRESVVLHLGGMITWTCF